MNKYLTFCIGVIWLFFLSIPITSAATYTVCSSGCDKTTVALAFSGYDLGPGDIIEVRADTPGGTTTVAAIGSWGLNDGGDNTGTVTLRGRAGDTIIVDSTGDNYGIYTSGMSYLSIENIEFRNATVANIYISNFGTNSGNISIIDCSSSGTGRAIQTQSGNSNITVTNFVSDHNTYSTGLTGVIIFQGGSNITLDNVTATQDITGPLLYGIYFNAVSNITMSDVEVTGFARNGINILTVSSGIISLTDIYLGVTREGVENGNAGIGAYIPDAIVPITLTNINSKYNDNYGMYLTGSSTLEINNSVFNNNVGHGLYLTGFSGQITLDTITANENTSYGIQAYNLTGNTTISDITVNNNGDTGMRVVSTAIDSLSMDNIEANDNGTGSGVMIAGNNALNNLRITDVTSNNNGHSGVSVENINGTSYLSGIEASYNGHYGAVLRTVNDFMYTNNNTHYNLGDGFNTDLGSTGVVTLSASNHNGAFGCGSGCGDGYSSHTTDDVDYYYNIGAFNTNTGFAHVQSTTGEFYNNISWANGSFDDSSAQRCQTYLTTDANPGWTIRNHISGMGETYNGYCEYCRVNNSYNDPDYNLYYPVSESTAK